MKKLTKKSKNQLILKFIENLEGCKSATKYKMKKHDYKKTIDRFISDVNALNKNFTINNLLEFYFSSNAIGLYIYPSKNDLYKWLQDGLEK